VFADRLAYGPTARDIFPAVPVSPAVSPAGHHQRPHHRAADRQGQEASTDHAGDLGDDGLCRAYRLKEAQRSSASAKFEWIAGQHTGVPRGEPGAAHAHRCPHVVPIGL